MPLVHGGTDWNIVSDCCSLYPQPASRALVGVDRERVFYPTVLIVFASYYLLFAVMGTSSRTLGLEITVAGLFFVLAVLGFKINLCFAAAALVGHGVLDFVHHLFIDNPDVPHWWPGFCLALDGILGAWLVVRLMRRLTA